MGKEKKQRDRGSGSIYERKDGRWVVSVVANGKRIYRYATSKVEAREKLKRLIRDLERGVKADAPRVTVAEYLEYWLNVHRSSIRDTSYTTYRTSIKEIIPALGHIRLSNLTGDQIQLGYMNMQQSLQLAQSTLRLAHTILKSALEDAVRWGYIAFNPAKHVNAPGTTKHEMHVLTLEQVHQLLEVTEGQMLCLLTVAVALGMRRGELIGLRWPDIHFDTKTVQINRSVSYLTVDGITQYIESAPKTEHGRRTIQLPDFVIDALSIHKTQQKERRLQAGANWKSCDLVFCNPTGEYLNPRFITRHFNQALQNAGLGHIRFHDLRHSAATILLAMNVHPKIVQELLGHSSISITLNIYSHALPSLHREVMDNLNAKFKKVQGEDKA